MLRLLVSLEQLDSRCREVEMLASRTKGIKVLGNEPKLTLPVQYNYGKSTLICCHKALTLGTQTSKGSSLRLARTLHAVAANRRIAFLYRTPLYIQ